MANNLMRLTPRQRGFVLGYRLGLRQARKELHAMAARWDDEIREVRKQAAAAATEVHRDLIFRGVRAVRAIEEAANERAGIPDAWLH